MNFGEINFPSSRAFWDDCDEDEFPETEGEKLELKFEATPPIDDILAKCKLIFVIEGINIFDFASATLLEGAIKIAEIPSKRSALYFVEENAMLLAIIEEDLGSSGEISELLIDLVKPAEAITLNIKPKIDYKSENIHLVKDDITFLRAIDGRFKNIETLDVPNFVTGVTAGIASWRFYEKLPVESYIAYTDNVALDQLAAKPVIKLIQDLGIKCSSTYIPKIRDNSNLYT